MIHILCDGLVLNPIDGWFMVFFKHGAGWVSAIIALIALLKTKRQIKAYYYSQMLMRIDRAITLATVSHEGKFSRFAFLQEDSGWRAGYVNHLMNKRNEYIEKMSEVI